MAYPYLALRPTGNGLVSHNVVAGSRNPTTSVVWSVKIVSLIRVLEHVKEESMRKIIINCIEKLADISDHDFDNHDFIASK